MYMGWDSSDTIRQYTSSGSTARFDIAACSSEGNYRIALHGNTAGKVISLQQPTAVRSNLVAATYTSNASYDDEWIFHKVMPRSGSELLHDLKCESILSVSINCYGYAVNALTRYSYVNRSGNESYFPLQMGQGLSDFLYGYTSEEHLMSAILGNDQIIGDSEWYGYDATRIEKENRDYVCSEGYYKVALAVEAYNDTRKHEFHWYRQGPNGLWSAKNGANGKVSFLDKSNKVIFDPQDCDRGQYEVFVCYFQIKPLSTVYYDMK